MSSTARLVSKSVARRSILSCQCSIRDLKSTVLTHVPARIYNPSSFASLSRSRHLLLARDLPSHTRALAILVPRRTYATETSTHGSDGVAFPPPGFNVNEAKKPPSQPKKSAQSSTKDVDQEPNEQHTVSKTEATAVDKTKALEKMTLSELAEAKASAMPNEKAAVKKEEEKRLTIGQKIKKEIQHYWDGTKLLATEVRISSKLALKMAAGYELSRRENRQVGTLS
jgi:LETM1 and EF-hand domain-containing protein 1, mitochondrial